MPGGACSSGRAPPTSWVNSVPAVSAVAMRGMARPGSVPGRAIDRWLLAAVELEAWQVVAVGRMEDGGPEVQPVAEELRHLLLPVDEHVGLLGHVLVELLPVRGDG